MGLRLDYYVGQEPPNFRVKFAFICKIYEISRPAIDNINQGQNMNIHVSTQSDVHSPMGQLLSRYIVSGKEYSAPMLASKASIYHMRSV